MRCRKVCSPELADPTRLQKAQARWPGELARQESKIARICRLGKIRQGCKRHERGCSANLRCKKVNSNGLADPARLQEARARWLYELAVQESNFIRIRQGCKRHERGCSANLRCKKVNSNGLADPARLQEARARWLYELAVQESNFIRIRQGCKRHERGCSANLRCKKVNSNGLADPARLQEARARWLYELAVQESNFIRIRQGCKRHERGCSANLRCKKVNSNGLADPARLQEARARWLYELAVQESNFIRVSRPGKVGKARARWLGELVMQESKLERVSRPRKVARGTSEVARRTCDARK
ncbi:hypothetical protein CDL15_Pgr004473 [Punica granatum]|uniref:Uncharacterized protein n=1 Tax=Punica granatum TaxID=22663 RepID=A0A218WCF0_PUNGR|nr:hypothetical protein CDL15_Pgr004473 [Punica granatum]